MARIILNRVTLWMLETEGGDPNYFEKVDIASTSTLEALRFILESNDILEWLFDFWDVEDKHRIRKKLEQVNGFCKDVHVIQIAEGKKDASKRRQLLDGAFIVNLVEVTLDVEPKV